MFMLVWVPEPVCQTDSGNSSSCLPASTSSAAATIASAFFASSMPSSRLTTAALRFTSASARISSGGMRSPEMSKWCRERWVCAPHRRSAGTSMSPKVSFSMRGSVMGFTLSRVRQRARSEGVRRRVCNGRCQNRPPMPLLPYPLARPFLFGLDPEDAHDLTLGAMAAIQHTPLVHAIAQRRVEDPVTLAGLRFPNRIGLAAGLDKNGRCIDAFGALGFGSVEVGTVTPLAQPGNPKPRMFRLVGATALINRLGFNNDGLAAFIRNVRRARFRRSGGILGLNIGKNAATPIERAVDDYLIGLAGVYPHADYVTINISTTGSLRF